MSPTNFSAVLTCSSLIAVCLMGSACGAPPRADESSAAQSAQPTPAAPAATPPRAPSRSACDLITAREASDIVGAPVIANEKSKAATSSTCSYVAGVQPTQEFQLTVQWTGGKEAWDINQKAGALGGKLLGADRDPAAAAVMKSNEAPLGDRATYNPILGGYVLKGDVLLEFNNLVTLRDPRAKWEKLARTALSRL